MCTQRYKEEDGIARTKRKEERGERERYVNLNYVRFPWCN